MSEFGVRKGLLIEKKEALAVSQVHLLKVQSSGFFLCQGKGKWEGQEVIDHLQTPGCQQGAEDALCDLSMSLFPLCGFQLI